MKTEDVQVGSTIMNGSSCIRVTEKVARDARWRTSGWRGINIALESFGGGTGTVGFVADYLLSGWENVPFEWRPVPGGAVEERYAWNKSWTRLVREVRKVEKDEVSPLTRAVEHNMLHPNDPPVFIPKTCSQSGQEGHVPHLWQETGIPTGNPLVVHSQWWQCGEQA